MHIIQLRYSKVNRFRIQNSQKSLFPCRSLVILLNLNIISAILLLSPFVNSHISFISFIPQVYPRFSSAFCSEFKAQSLRAMQFPANPGVRPPPFPALALAASLIYSCKIGGFAAQSFPFPENSGGLIPFSILLAFQYWNNSLVSIFEFKSFHLQANWQRVCRMLYLRRKEA